MLTAARVGEGRSSQTKGNAGGSTSAWHHNHEWRHGPGDRRSVVGGPARQGDLLARPGAPSRRANGSRAPGVERLAVCELGTPAGAGKGPLTLPSLIVADEWAPVLQRQHCHPWRDLAVASLSLRARNDERTPAWFRSLTREGDVRGDNAPTTSRWLVTPGMQVFHRMTRVFVSHRTCRFSRAQGDVQGDVGPPC